MQTITLINTPEHPLLEREIAEAALAFANGADLEIQGLVADHGRETGDEALKGMLALNAILQRPPEKSGAKVKSPNTAERDLMLLEWKQAYQKALQSRLIYVMEKPDVAAKGVIQGWELISTRPILTIVPGGLRLSHYFAFNNILELCETGMALLLDVDRGFSKDLCHCQLESCRRFFFVKKRPSGQKGRYFRKHCNAQHAEQDHKEAGRMRTAKHRIRKAEVLKKGRRK